MVVALNHAAPELGQGLVVAPNPLRPPFPQKSSVAGGHLTHKQRLFWRGQMSLGTCEKPCP